MIAELFNPQKATPSEITIAKRKLQQARSLFDSATDASFDYANAELTAALKYMDYVLKKGRMTGEVHECRKSA